MLVTTYRKIVPTVSVHWISGRTGLLIAARYVGTGAGWTAPFQALGLRFDDWYGSVPPSLCICLNGANGCGGVATSENALAESDHVHQLVSRDF